VQTRAESDQLSLWDTISIIVGIVIGAGIFETAPLIFATLDHAGLSLLVWLFGGVLSLIGALCYAELASAYPRSGGDYVYLTKSYGPWMGFLFGWAQLAVILTGSIGMMAFIFADYARALWEFEPGLEYLLASLAVVALCLINVFGLPLSKHTQNALSAAKIFGLVLVVGAGLYTIALGSSEGLSLSTPTTISTSTAAIDHEGTSLWSALSLALIFVLYTFGGWNDAAFVASEVKDQKRNLPRALIFGTLAITTIYLLVNAAYVFGLGLEGAKNSQAIAADLLRAPFGSLGASLMSIVVIISALSAVQGLIFTGSRVFSALGADHHLFKKLSHINPRNQTPTISLLATSSVSILFIVMVGSPWGQQIISTFFFLADLQIPEWSGRGGFEIILMCTAPIFWLFFLLTGLSIFILRKREPQTERPFRVPLYPFIPAIFCLTCAFMLYRSVIYAGSLSLVGVALLAIGLPLYFYSRRAASLAQPLRPAAVYQFRSAVRSSHP